MHRLADYQRLPAGRRNPSSLRHSLALRGDFRVSESRQLDSHGLQKRGPAATLVFAQKQSHAIPRRGQIQVVPLHSAEENGQTQ